MNKLFEPIRINNTIVKNRLVVSPMVVCYVKENGEATERYIAYHENKAKGGWGLIITEDYVVGQKVGGFKTLPGLWEDSQISSHQELTRRVHQHGAKILAQIYHAGRETGFEITGQVPVGPSPIKEPTMPDIPRELTVEDILIIVEQFGDCALRAKKAGFDGVEVHGAHGYLINAFTSGFSNKRTDEYGGTIVNRARFATEIIKNIREKTGDDFVISYRMSTVEYVPGGITIEEAKVIAKLVENAGANMIHCSQGLYVTTEHIIAPGVTGRANYIQNTKAIKDTVNIPVIAVGRINDPLIAENIVNEGKADMIAMGRASLADPDFPNKTMAERYDDIIRCIGCNQGCIGENNRANPVRCLVNPRTGMEYLYDMKEAKEKKTVYVAGGGVSGCEAAIAAALRGHDVSLYEKSAVLGGQWLAASVPIGKSEFCSFVVWQKKQLKDLGVKVNLNTAMTEEILTKEKPDAVILAVGSKENIIKLDGLETGNVITVSDVLLGRKKVGNKALVIGGGSAGCETADHIAYHGCSDVTVVEIANEIVMDMEVAPKKYLLQRMNEEKICVLKGTCVKSIEGTTVTLIDSRQKEIILEGVDTIIMAVGMKPETELAEKLQQLKVANVVSVGDCRSVKDGYHNIQEAFEAGYYL